MEQPAVYGGHSSDGWVEWYLDERYTGRPYNVPPEVDSDEVVPLVPPIESIAAGREADADSQPDVWDL
jgi:hypothetical protein